MASRNSTILITILTLALVGSLISSGFLYQDVQDDKRKAQARTEQLLSQQAAASNKANWKPVVLSIEDQVVYFPNIKLKLPLSELTAQFAYANREVGGSGIQSVTDVTTASFETFVPTRTYRLSCTPVRLAFEEKANPYSPSETPKSSVKLKDGRTLQIYGFQENSCKDRWKLTGVDSPAMVKAFESAESY